MTVLIGVILNGDVTHGGGEMTSNGVVADKHKHPATVAETTGGPFDALYRDEPRHRQDHYGNGSSASVRWDIFC